MEKPKPWDELREYVWERCPADDHDTDEVMAKFEAYHNWVIALSILINQQ